MLHGARWDWFSLKELLIYLEIFTEGVWIQYLSLNNFQHTQWISTAETKVCLKYWKTRKQLTYPYHLPLKLRIAIHCVCSFWDGSKYNVSCHIYSAYSNCPYISNVIARSNNRIGLEPTKECAAIYGYHRNETCNDEQRSNSRSVVNNIQYTLIIKLGSGKFPDELNFGMSRVTDGPVSTIGPLLGTVSS